MSSSPIDQKQFGVSFSVKQCRNFGIDPAKTLDWLIKEMGFRRFRLMSYWDEIERDQGKYDFTELDRQLASIAKVKGVVTLAIGVKQPRWPEYHWPDWVWSLSKIERDEKLLEYLRTVIERYKSNNIIISWQLENEALLKNFGEKIDIDRGRLAAEYALVTELDPPRPIIMSTSNSFGIPFLGPIPDIVGFSYYLVMHNKGKYTRSFRFAWAHRLRAIVIRLLWSRPSFIHELQVEPWGPKAIWEMSKEEQDESMSLEQIKMNFRKAKATGLHTIDLWGGEWWYWRARLFDDETIVEIVKTFCKNS